MSKPYRPLDKETERLMFALRDGGMEDIAALRSRIRLLMTEAKRGQIELKTVPPPRKCPTIADPLESTDES